MAGYPAPEPPILELEYLHAVNSHVSVQYELNCSQAVFLNSNIDAHEQLNVSTVSAGGSVVDARGVVNADGLALQTTTWTGEKQLTSTVFITLEASTLIASADVTTTAALVMDASSLLKAASVTTGLLSLSADTVTLGGSITSGSLQLSARTLSITSTGIVTAPILLGVTSDVATLAGAITCGAATLDVVNLYANGSIAAVGDVSQKSSSLRLDGSGSLSCSGSGCSVVLNVNRTITLSTSASVVGSSIAVEASELVLEDSSFFSATGRGSSTGGSPDAFFSRSSSSCGRNLMPSDACECSLAAESLGISYSSAANQEWPQGCIIRDNAAYWASSVQTGSNVPVASDGGGSFICRVRQSTFLLGEGANGGSCLDSSIGGGSGGGHGGDGGYGVGNSAALGAGYGDLFSPSTPGSGGGGGFYSNPTLTPGGAGGGVINVSLSGVLTLAAAAKLEAKGAGGTNGITNTDRISAGGGGAGGSILVVASSVVGQGTMDVSGGSGGARARWYRQYYWDRWGSAGGGGGGGRIAVHAASSLSSDILLEAKGGTVTSGAVAGAAGTIYTSVGGNRSLVIDNSPTASSASAPVVRVPEYVTERSDCSNDCLYSSDGKCDDGGDGAEFSLCEFDADCADCGYRAIAGFQPSVVL